MKARFFYAPHINHKNGRATWSKLFVLTEDGRFYCEYLDYMLPAKVELILDFNSFKASDYRWGGYQYLLEITKGEAISKRLIRQINWVDSYLSSQVYKEEVDIKQAYLGHLSVVDSIKLVIVGQDPYPVGANGIAFCKNTFSELEDFRCCGKDVLHSLGIDLDQAKNKFSSPIELFMHLLNQGIAFINVNHELFSSNSNIEKYKGYNDQFLSKANKIVVLGLSTAKTAFLQHYRNYSNVSYFIHPSGRNKNTLPEQWNAIWASTYLKNNYLTNII